ncbi:MAG: sulfite exporter TauE/SafE family protein [Oceanococcus sp.]
MIWLLALAAFCGACLSAVAGLGGGTLLIGVMFALGLAPALAIPLHAAVQLVSNGSRAVAYWRHIDWPSMLWFSLACVPLPFLTARWVSNAEPDVIRVILAAAILLSLMPLPKQLKRGWSVRTKMLLAGGLNGVFGMIIGATGLVIGPFFLDPSWRRETTVGTLAICQCVGHATKIAAFGMIGIGLHQHWQLLLPLMVAVALGTVLGRQLMRSLSHEQFVRLFRLVLAVLAIRLAWVGGWGLLTAA